MSCLSAWIRCRSSCSHTCSCTSQGLSQLRACRIYLVPWMDHDAFVVFDSISKLLLLCLNHSQLLQQLRELVLRLVCACRRLLPECLVYETKLPSNATDLHQCRLLYRAQSFRKCVLINWVTFRREIATAVHNKRSCLSIILRVSMGPDLEVDGVACNPARPYITRSGLVRIHRLGSLRRNIPSSTASLLTDSLSSITISCSTFLVRRAPQGDRAAVTRALSATSCAGGIGAL